MPCSSGTWALPCEAWGNWAKHERLGAGHCAARPRLWRHPPASSHATGDMAVPEPAGALTGRSAVLRRLVYRPGGDGHLNHLLVQCFDFAERPS